MKKTTKLFVTIYYYGCSSWGYIPRSEEREIESEQEGYEIAFNMGLCYGYSLGTKECIEINGKIYEGQEIENYKTFVFGSVYTRKQIRRMKDHKWLVKEMRKDRVNKLVKTRVDDNWIGWSADIEYISV